MSGTEPIEPAIVGYLDGRPVRGWSQLTDGRVLCQLCFGHYRRDQLHHDQEGTAWDICGACHQKETKQ